MHPPGRTNIQGKMNFASKSAKAEAESKRKSTNSSVCLLHDWMRTTALLTSQKESTVWAPGEFNLTNHMTSIHTIYRSYPVWFHMFRKKWQIWEPLIFLEFLKLQREWMLVALRPATKPVKTLKNNSSTNSWWMFDQSIGTSMCSCHSMSWPRIIIHACV